MASPINIYEETTIGVFHKKSLYGASINISPIKVVCNGEDGEVRELRLFIRADNEKEYYSSITMTPASLVTPSYVDNTSTGWGVKLSATNLQPTESDWDGIDYANTITFDNIGTSSAGDINTYLPFWVRIECPANASIGNIEDVVLTLNYTASPVS
jgi:hypothetical protein